jgi:ATP-dependent exoDNAse (exonuclease V) beta subunit
MIQVTINYIHTFCLVILHEFGHEKTFKVRVKFYLFMDAGFHLVKKNWRNQNGE